MTTLSILNNIDSANFERVRFAADCYTMSFERLSHTLMLALLYKTLNGND
jgi:hypothetical protein